MRKTMMPNEHPVKFLYPFVMAAAFAINSTTHRDEYKKLATSMAQSCMHQDDRVPVAMVNGREDYAPAGTSDDKTWEAWAGKMNIAFMHLTRGKRKILENVNPGSGMWKLTELGEELRLSSVAMQHLHNAELFCKVMG